MTSDTTTHILDIFHPAPPNTTGRWWADIAAPVPADGLLVSPDIDDEHRANGAGTPLVHTLHRALTLNGTLPRHFNASPSHEGEAWYDALPIIDAVEVTLLVDGREISRAEAVQSIGANSKYPAHPDRIIVRPQLRLRGEIIETDTIETDVVLFPSPDGGDDPYSTCVAVTADTTIDPAALADLLGSAFFSHSPWSSGPSYNAQRRDYTEDAFERAVHVVLDPIAAARALITRLAFNRIRYLVPDGAAVSLKLNRNEVIEVVVSTGNTAT